MFRHLHPIAALLALVACQRPTGADAGPEDVATTIPARTSAASGDNRTQDRPNRSDLPGAALLAEPGAIALEQLGYPGAPSPLGARAQRRHAVGHLAIADGRFERATRAFEEVLADNPDSALDHYNLATAHVGAGRWELAANALAQGLVREFPHLWNAYLVDPALADLRASTQHLRLEALAKALRQLHERVRLHGTPTTITWSHSRQGAGAQAGAEIDGRFVPLAPRVWTTTALDDAALVVDAYYDKVSGRVINVHATAHPGLHDVSIEFHDASTGRRLSHRTIDLGRATGIEIDSGERPARLRKIGGADRAWRDLRGRRTGNQDEAAASLRVAADGMHTVDGDLRRIAWVATSGGA